jgi:hypothetical protein
MLRFWDQSNAVALSHDQKGSLLKLQALHNAVLTHRQLPVLEVHVKTKSGYIL